MNYIEIIGLSLFIGILIWSTPYNWFISKIKQENNQLITCAGCMGTWIGILYGTFNSCDLIEICSIAGIVAFIAEMSNRILNTWRL